LIIGIDANRLAQTIRSTTLIVMVPPFYQESLPISIAKFNAFHGQVPVSQQPLNTLLPKSPRLSCFAM
jgi:hypothetical protein